MTMSKFIGRQNSFGLAKETVRGTPVDPTFWLPHMELTVDEKVQQVVDESTVNRIEDSQDANVVGLFAQGNARGRIQDKSFGLVLLSSIGQVSSALKGGETIVYEHTFTPLQSAQHQS